MMFFLDSTPRLLTIPYPLRMIAWQPNHTVFHHNRVVETLLISICMGRSQANDERINNRNKHKKTDLSLSILLPGTHLESHNEVTLDELLFSYHIPVGERFLQLGLSNCTFTWSPSIQTIFDTIIIELQKAETICPRNTKTIGQAGIGLADRLDLLALQIFLEIKLSSSDNCLHGVSSLQQRFPDMISWLLNHAGDSLDMEQFYQRFHVTRSVFYREWRRHFSISVHQYLLNHRIQLACRMLTTTGFSLSEISCQCGFNSISYFHQAFRKIIGTTPADFRRSSTKQEGHAR